MGFKFEDLKVWRRALDFSYDIHCLTRSFPKEELFILSRQIKRAADSIALNIAEGSIGQSNAEYRQFVNYAMRSAVEVVSCLYVGRRRRIVSEADFKKYYAEADEITKMLQGLKRSLK